MLKKGYTVKIRLGGPGRKKIEGTVSCITNWELVILCKNSVEVLPWYTIKDIEVTSVGLPGWL